MKRITELLQERKQRGYAIATSKGQSIVQKDSVWLVPSATSPNKTYKVRLTIEGSRCDCEDFKERGIMCKHAFAVEYITTKTLNNDGSIITETKRTTYTQNWKAYDLATEQQKELFQKLLNDLCNTIDEKPYVFGRPRMHMRDMVFASALKVYSTFSLRRFAT
ncbi:MAG: SWIM zinc finger family protein, partial [Candidatus Parvarchaeum sp.]